MYEKGRIRRGRAQIGKGLTCVLGAVCCVDSTLLSLLSNYPVRAHTVWDQGSVERRVRKSGRARAHHAEANLVRSRTAEWEKGGRAALLSRWACTENQVLATDLPCRCCGSALMRSSFSSSRGGLSPEMSLTKFTPLTTLSLCRVDARVLFPLKNQYNTCNFVLLSDLTRARAKNKGSQP